MIRIGDISMIESIKLIEKSDLESSVQSMLDNGYRFMTLTCVEIEDRFDIIYHFGKGYDMSHLRIDISKFEELQSISGIYFCALLVENEIKDLFGVKVVNIAIDYQGKFLLSEGAQNAPMCNNQIQIEVRS